MNYLIINGSPRRQNTWKIVERIKDTLSDNDTSANFWEVDLMKEDIPLCMGCFSCFMNGEDSCPHADKVQPIVEMMKKCDGLIITSPVYALNVTALIKNFIDHLAYFFHRPYFFNKKAIVVTTTAGAGAKDAGKYLDETLRHFGYNKRYKLCFVNSYDARGKLPFKVREEIDKQTLKFYDDIKEDRLYSPSFKALFYYNMWRSMAYNGHVKADQNYWVENNMMDSEFHPDIPCSGLKKLPFKIFYKIMLMFLSQNKVEAST
ncbi:MAG: NAD(P)H-dependent oxidoreductase [Methanosphaera sp.]|uniref:flavodoxin family protein n=1 Tax=Methanosphaera sp. TaxID=2666342 RepID=UPI0025E05BA7|nr:NAD(P)H-dependent oxidoreductase [Methanosphaera sp.]MCI5866880.1 flavodoxin family protein [Methanosphaera sp.]MDD6534387.1 NAD(P)H-dependent oxidoreductase [Methanosphaera sp.]MDY3955208.1 NAD(P)H-dependent oxidoreductase [Methanosphaera sp.]